MGIVRWNQATHTHQRFSQFDGLPSSEIYAVAVDPDGNRWFGGNNGLSRLDASSRWTHFNTGNSGLYSNTISGIAIAGNGSVWLIHGLPDGPLSRLGPDGSWRWYPSREAAVPLHFAEILETSNANKLWTVARGEVWVGYDVFDGTFWHQRSPPSAWDNPTILVADLDGNVYTTVSLASPFVELAVWDGVGWSMFGTWWPRVEHMAFDPDNRLWMGYTLVSIGGYLPTTIEYFVSRVEGDGFVDTVETSTRVRGLLAGPDGRWAVGDGWILEPGATGAHVFPDIPAPQALVDVSTSTDGRAWIVTEVVERNRWDYSKCESTLQLVDDNGTGRWDDDTWQSTEMGSWMRRSEPMPGGDMLYVMMFDERPITGPPRRCVVPRLQRWHDGAFLTQYVPPFVNEVAAIHDIYVQDNSRIWFAYSTPTGEASIAGISDRGTPEDNSDDLWVRYPLLPLNHGGHIAVAVDAENRVWYADPTGVYRREGDQWRAIHNEGIQDLTPTASGAMLLHGRWDAASNDWTSNLATVVRADDSVAPWATLAGFIALHLDLAQSAMRRNTQWQVADDGAVWYRRIDYTTFLNRRDEAGLTESPRTYPANITSFAVGANNHVWARVDGLWRLSPQPGFSLSAVPSHWLVAPGTAATARPLLESIEGFNQPVTLSVSGLPPQVAADFDPNPVVAGSPLTMTLAVEAGAALGSYTASLQADAYSVSHSVPLTVTVVSMVRTRWLPVLLHDD